MAILSFPINLKVIRNVIYTSVCVSICVCDEGRGLIEGLLLGYYCGYSPFKCCTIILLLRFRSSFLLPDPEVNVSIKLFMVFLSIRMFP